MTSELPPSARLTRWRTTVAALTITTSIIAIPATAENKQELRPNILWLDAEDANIHWFGCYGNPAATTPHIDQLAKEGFRYTHAFACAPVCSPSRSGWITGIRAVSMGTLHLRSKNPIPHAEIPYYPDLLQAAGYHATNPGKTDYNIGGRPDRQAWNRGQDWRGRDENQPFFHVEHLQLSHESHAFGNVENPQHDPAKQQLRAYHPDIPPIRHNYAHYADAVQRMDIQVKDTLEKLERDGLADSTIVIFTTDHGGVMPRSKRFLHDSGTRSPLIIRIPEKFKHLWPADEPGTTVDRLVSFVDMPKTWLSIAQAETPARMQGRIFLGPDAQPPRDTHFGATGRQADRYYEMRSVRNRDFLYIKNYKPYISTGQRLGYKWQMVAARAWEQHHLAGKTDEITGAFFQPTQPTEFLFDVRKDPDNTINLANQPDYQDVMKSMRARLREWQLEVHDTSILAEEEMAERARQNNTTIYEMVRDPNQYDLPAYLDAADLALETDPENIGHLVERLAHEDSGIRYWAAIGLLMLDSHLHADAIKAVTRILDDESHVNRAIAAWALLRARKEIDAARACLIALLRGKSHATLLALTVIDLSGEPVAPYREAIQGGLNSPFGHGYSERMKTYLLNDRVFPGAAGEPVDW